MSNPSTQSCRTTSSPWAVRLTAHSTRDLDRLQQQQPAFYNELVAELKTLGTSPFPAPPKGKKLKGLNGVFWRLRVGAYRVLYRPIESRTLLILRVIPRRELDRVLKSL